MNTIYLWLGFVVFWVAVLASSVFIIDYVYAAIRRNIEYEPEFGMLTVGSSKRKGGRFHLSILSRTSFERSTKKMLDSSGLNKQHPNSIEKIVRAKTAACLVGDCVYSILGLRIVHNYKMMDIASGKTPLTPEQLKKWNAIKTQYINGVERNENRN